MKLFWPKDREFEEVLHNVQSAPLNRAFSEELLAFTQALSKRFVKLRHLPEVVALGFWLRKANVKKMQEHFEVNTKDKIVRPRGLVFHIAPSNVDTIFVYSWVLSLLAGNKNVIRISSRMEVNELLNVILDEIANHEKIARTTIFCTYGHEENTTVMLSEVCHTRVIWGGDETISNIRESALAPLANELSFGDRFSLAVLNSEKVASLNEAELDHLLENFYNDVFWFNQMACSSPRLVIWKGKAIQNFWDAFENKVQQKQYELLAATQVLKYATGLQLATKEQVSRVSPTTYFSRVELQAINQSIRELHCGGGLFYEYEVAQLADVSQIISDKDQTLAYYGFEHEQLIELVDVIQSRGIDRIVPVGKALDFNGVWDGQSFLTSFTREVVIL
jgi:hypothetical protein